MGMWTDLDGRLWTDEPRHCWAPNGGLLTWCASIADGAVHRHMYRLGRKSLSDAEGEDLRKRWGGTPD